MRRRGKIGYRDASASKSYSKEAMYSYQKRACCSCLESKFQPFRVFFRRFSSYRLLQSYCSVGCMKATGKIVCYSPKNFHYIATSPSRKHWAAIGQIGAPIGVTAYTRCTLRALKIFYSDTLARDGLQWIKKNNFSEHPVFYMSYQ